MNIHKCYKTTPIFDIKYNDASATLAVETSFVAEMLEHSFYVFKPY